MQKKKMSLYRSIRSKEWFKIKTKMRQEVVIGGFTKPRGARQYFGSLLVGVYENDGLVYVGHVGSGFSDKSLKAVYLKMIKLKSKKCPFITPPQPNAPVTWLQPKLVAEVIFAEWTQAALIRQPIFQGIRQDKSAEEVVREKEIQNF